MARATLHSLIPGSTDHNWAELREPDEITESAQRRISKAALLLRPERRREFVEAANDQGKLVELMANQIGEDVDAMKAMSDAHILAFVREWSFNMPIAEDSLLELTSKDYDALELAVRNVGSAHVDFTPTPPDGTETPTEPSSA